MDFDLAIKPYHYHAVLCAGKNCTEGMKLVKYLKQRIQDEGLQEGEFAVRVNRAGCLGICSQGPIMVVYPQGIWYAGLNEAVIDQIIESHFRQHTPLASHCFHQQAAV